MNKRLHTKDKIAFLAQSPVLITSLKLSAIKHYLTYSLKLIDYKMKSTIGEVI